MTRPRFTATKLYDMAAARGTPMDGPRPVERAPKKRSYEEHDAQVAVIRWWATIHQQYGLPEILLYANVNGSALGTGREDWQVKQRMIRGKRLKSEGLRPGVFDLFLAVARNGFHGCYLEMKTDFGVVSKEQREFREAVRAQGYVTAVCRSSADAINVIDGYLKP